MERIYRRLTDIDVYSAMLNRDFDLFIRLAGELAETFVRERFDYVAGDAAEGHNPTHDVCRLIINAAVEMADGGKAHRVTNFDFLLNDQPDPRPEAHDPSSTFLNLSEEALAWVSAGYYKHVIRYRDHAVPIAEALRRYVERTG